jgi:glycosyltransferase involved in cell wall biosynthesis
VIRNSHDTRIDTRPERGLRETLGLGDDAFLIVTVGNDKPGAATAQAIRALRELPDRVHMAFVGSGYEPHAEEIRALGLGDRVHLLPPVAPTEVVPFMASADAAAVLYHALTTDYLYSLPNRFFSAVAAGLPLLYPQQLPELSGLVERYEMGVGIDPRDPASVAEGIAGLIGDGGAVAERLRANVARASEELSWKADEGRLAAVVEAALGAGRAR